MPSQNVVPSQNVAVEPRARLSIAAVATRTGLTAHTLRYYEATGLMLHQVERAPSQHRRYSEADITWVVFLTRLRSTGMPISRIKEYVELARRGDATSADRLELLLRHRISVVAQLEEVQRSLAAIDYKISVYTEQVGKK
ncbi:MerR family transcriptional regulator [Glaciibacter sp. 2TAF33]|uniref:MerR family transcriptional regulator n=1 Tax=Glaciibacter sp. 2TAF33 TaxID=3233015 RepID=UPI003F8F828E